MRWLLILLAVFGIVVSSLALREHYRTDLGAAASKRSGTAAIVNQAPTPHSTGIPLPG